MRDRLAAAMRLRLIVYTTLAAFVSNIFGAFLASNTGLFLLDSSRYEGLALAFNILPFLCTLGLFAIYLAPTLSSGADEPLLRRKILGTPTYFLGVAAAGWGIAALEAGFVPVLLGRKGFDIDTLLAVVSTVGIGILASSIGYFLLELLNRRYWFPRFFQRSLDAKRSHSRISVRLLVYFTAVSIAPFTVFGWILSWVALKAGAFTFSQLAFMAAFSLFVLLAGIITTAAFSRLFHRPLLEAKNAVQHIAGGNFNVRLGIRSDDEIGLLGEGINDMASALKGDAERIATLNRELETTQAEIIATMGAIGESRSGETGRHVVRVAAFSRLLALAAGMGSAEAELLAQASPMHDIGKVGIPDSILNKVGPLTPEEYEAMKAHTVLGHAMFARSERRLLRIAAAVAHEHHERVDGSGYPRGLSGEAISSYGRITAIADVFDALGSPRVYKPAWEDEQVFAHFAAQRGRHFDARLVDLLLHGRAEFLRLRDSLRDPA